MNITKIKKAIQKALYNEYGFKPSIKDIGELEFSDCVPDYEIVAWFTIGRWEYEFASEIDEDGNIYVGENTITKEKTWDFANITNAYYSTHTWEDDIY